MTAAVLTKYDEPNRAAVCAEAWVRLLDALRELAEQCNPLDVHPADVLDKLPHLARPVAVERFGLYAEALQEAGQLDAADHSPATYVRREELEREVREQLDAMLAGHPYAPAWTGAVHADPVYLAGQVTRYRLDAEDYRRQRDAAERWGTWTARQRAELAALKVANAELAEALDMLRPYNLTEAAEAELDPCDAGDLDDAPAGELVALPLPGVPPIGSTPLSRRLGDPAELGDQL